MSHKNSSSTQLQLSKLLTESIDELSQEEIMSCLKEYYMQVTADFEKDLFSEQTKPGVDNPDSPIERRMYERFDLGIPVVLVSGNRMFRSYTKNISSGGMLLAEKPQRDFAKGDLKIIVQYPDHTLNIEIPAKFADSSECRRLDFRKASKDSIQQLNALIEFELRASQGQAA